METPRHLILGIGNNDLDHKDTTNCVSEMKLLLGFILNQHTSLEFIHVLPAFERVGKPAFNSRVSHFNDEIKNFCINTEKCKFIDNSLISSLDPSQFYDGVHFSSSGIRNFVRIVKTHMNPFLGLKMYTVQPQRQQQHYRRHLRPNSFQRGQGQQGTPNRNRGSVDRNTEINNLIRHLIHLTNG